MIQRWLVRHTSVVVVLAGVLLPRDVSAQGASAWRSLFDGRTLTGWYRCNGAAPFSVENGTITGRSVINSPNSFLCTREQFGDFILEFDLWLGSSMNSGVQFRSIADSAIKGGRVHGYQLDVDPTERRWTGGIYDESRRGWLHTLASQPAARRAFRLGTWNRFRVEAIGTSIRTWVNGVAAANILDDQSSTGIIALQVHDIGSDTSKAGQVVRFRNIRIRTDGLAAARTPERADAVQFNHIANTLTPRERAAGWRLLWDGRSTNGWRGARRTDFPPEGWDISDGMLQVRESGGREASGGGDIVTVDEYENFELTLEYRLSRGANSGIHYLVNTVSNTSTGSVIGSEYQLLDNDVHPDAKLGVNGNRTNAGLYDLIPPQNLRFNGIGEWNRARIVVRGRRVEHWLNGFRTVSYERGTQEWRALVDHTKFAAWPNFGEAVRGRILLQDHGNAVAFRSIKLRPLPSGDAP